MQGKSIVCRPPVRIQNAGTTACGLVVAFCEDDILCYHWPFMLIDKKNEFEQSMDGRTAKRIVIVSNGFRKSELIKNSSMQVAKYLKSVCSNTQYYIIDSETDCDPFVELDKGKQIQLLLHKYIEISIQ